MPVYRMQLSTWTDNLDPTSAMIITPHFEDHGLTTDPANLAHDLVEAWHSWLIAGMQGTRVECKVYDAQGAKPNPPKATYVKNPTGIKNSSAMREAAICLSFYADSNEPRRRGRLYIPSQFVATAINGRNVGSAERTKVAALVPIFAGLGGLDVDWCVYSRVNGNSHKVTNWWVDDAWDIQRRRGGKATTKDTGSTSG